MLASLPQPRTVIYLDVPPSICLIRIRDRGRECEQGIRLGYLQGLSESYGRLLSDLKEQGIPVVTINWSDFGTREGGARRIHEILIKAKTE